MSGIWISLTGNQNKLVLFSHVFCNLPIFDEIFSTHWTLQCFNFLLHMNNHIDEVIAVTSVEESLRWNGRWKNICKSGINIILVLSRRYQDSRHILQNPKNPKNVMGFSNRAQRFTARHGVSEDLWKLAAQW